MIPIIHLQYPILPPTSNRIYRKGTALTDEAREYAERFSLAMVRFQHLFLQIDDTAVFGLHLRFFMNLLNPSWNNPAVPPSRRAKSRYKRIDLDNRIKLLTDCIRDAIDVDDSQIFAASQEKHHVAAESEEHLEAFIQEVPPSLFGV